MKGTSRDDVVTGNDVFRPRARIIRTLGRELISNEFVAVQELVKNAYDADAATVILEFRGAFGPDGGGSLTILDDGHGMTLDVLRSAWMEPATVSKVNSRKSRNGRAVTGEKGIGRFAAARIAETLYVESVAATTDRRMSAKFEWGRFDDPDRYLDELTCEWRDEPANGAPVGTLLRLEGLNDNWAQSDRSGSGASFRRLKGELSRLVSPLGVEEFEIELIVPAPFSSFSGKISPPSFLASPQYTLVGQVDAEGQVTADYTLVGGSPTRIKEKLPLPRDLFSAQQVRCGPFAFELRVWDREADALRMLATQIGSTLRDVRRDLDAASGIAIYRDGFRVMIPENDDWLRLDLRRVNNPTMRLSNNQVVGVVAITQEKNPKLVDQSSRQGIVESPAYADFREVVRYILSLLESERDRVRRPASLSIQRSEGLFADLSIASLRSYAVDKYSADTQLRTLLDAFDATLGTQIEAARTVLSRYRRLSTLGTLIDVVLHEGRTPIGLIRHSAEIARQRVRAVGRAIHEAQTLDHARMSTLGLFEGINKQLAKVDAHSESLAALFKRLAPFSGRGRTVASKTTIEQILSNIVGLLHERIEADGIEVELPTGETPITVYDQDMSGIFLNLIDNAIFWVSTNVETSRRISVRVEKDALEIVVLVSDSGPGVAERDRDRIFQPYVTRKPDGVGLGLTIAGELCAEYGGTLELLADGPLEGATFRASLSVAHLSKTSKK